MTDSLLLLCSILENLQISTRLYWSSSDQYERHSATTTLRNIGVKKVAKEKSGGKKKVAVKKMWGKSNKSGDTKMGVKKKRG